MTAVDQSTTSDVLSAYYVALITKGIPGPLAHDIVFDAAKRFHAGEIEQREIPA